MEFTMSTNELAQIDAAMVLQNELYTNERLLWHGRPKQGLMLRPADALMIPFSLLWGGFAIFWEVMAIAGGAPFFFALWGIPFVLVGLYMIAGRFFVDAARRNRTYYALTSERVLIISGIFNRSVRTLRLRTLADVNLTVGRNGRGTITFGPSSLRSWGWAGTSWPDASKQLAPSFEMIENPQVVYGQIQQAQNNLSDYSQEFQHD
jgi:hypothetical protein